MAVNPKYSIIIRTHDLKSFGMSTGTGQRLMYFFIFFCSYRAESHKKFLRYKDNLISVFVCILNMLNSKQEERLISLVYSDQDGVAVQNRFKLAKTNEFFDCD